MRRDKSVILPALYKLLLRDNADVRTSEADKIKNQLQNRQNLALQF